MKHIVTLGLKNFIESHPNFHSSIIFFEKTKRIVEVATTKNPCIYSWLGSITVSLGHPKMSSDNLDDF